MLFDPENVLYDATLWGRWLCQLLHRVGLHATFPEFFETWERDFRPEVDTGRRDYWDALADFLQREGLSHGATAEIFAAGACRKRRFESEVRFLPGVVETLVRLASAGVPLAVLADTPQRGDVVLRDLERMGLKNVFRGVVTSLDLGEPASSAACLQKAVEICGAPSEETALVASRPAMLAGAATAKLQPIAANPVGEVSADVSLERFSDLPLMAALPSAAKAAG